MILNSKISGSGPNLVILHGLFGSLENWGAMAQKLAGRFRIIRLDLRNHGASPHAESTSYRELAEDVAQTLSSLNVTHYYLLGHSMGGKVAMTLAALQNTAPQAPTNAPRLGKMIVVDIAPRAYAPTHLSILHAMQSVDTTSLSSRKSADNALQHAIPDSVMRQFILTNLVRVAEQGFKWRLNLQALAAGYSQLLEMPDRVGIRQPVLVIRGTESDYVNADDEALFAELYPNCAIVAIEGAGHWPHASHSQDVFQAISPFLTD